VTISAKQRWYRYIVQNQRFQSAHLPHNAIWISHPLNVEAMNEASQLILGEHHFKSFQCESGQQKHAYCKVLKAQWHQVEESHSLLAFDIIANRFVYKMVRSLVGTLLEIGKGQLPANEMQRIIKAENRSQAYQTAPARGLTLMTADYGPNTPFFKNDVYVSILSTQVKCLTLVDA
jgi:tRNA pseudouridine38-40 synthase